MNIVVFNACVLIGWVMVLAGGWMLNPAFGLIGAGALLIAMTFFASFLGGVHRKAQH